MDKKTVTRWLWTGAFHVLLIISAIALIDQLAPLFAKAGADDWLAVGKRLGTVLIAGATLTVGLKLQRARRR